jgi:hypothetical protein
MRATKPPAQPGESYQEQDAEGHVRTFFLSHPAGNRRMRRAFLFGVRHSPKYTKPFHVGREWYRLENQKNDEA